MQMTIAVTIYFSEDCY